MSLASVRYAVDQGKTWWSRKRPSRCVEKLPERALQGRICGTAETGPTGNIICGKQRMGKKVSSSEDERNQIKKERVLNSSVWERRRLQGQRKVWKTERFHKVIWQSNRKKVKLVAIRNLFAESILSTDIEMQETAREIGNDWRKLGGRQRRPWP